MGVCIRDSPKDDLSCYSSSCIYTNPSDDGMHAHIQKEHHENKKIKHKVILFPALRKDRCTKMSSQTLTEVDDHANLASGEESKYEVRSAFGVGVGPVRQKMPRHSVRPTPYERTGESSSESASPSQRPSLKPLSPIPLPAVPSPLHQLAYSQNNSPPPPLLNNEMTIDEPTEDEVLAKASFTIIPLPHLNTMPPTRLLACTKCLHGVLPSSLISHSKEHGVNLMPAEKKSLQMIMDNSSFLQDSIEVTSPNPPCPPIEGILVQDGFACNLCSHCCTTIRSMQTHFSDKHKGTPGFTKGNSKPVQVQALFACRPKYFVVTPSLRGHNKEDLFTIYLQQCAPEIEALKILNPPLNANEVPPLLKVMQWHEHLKDYIDDRDSVRKLRELMQLPTSNKGEAWMGSPLRATIEGYMKRVRVDANNSVLGIRCLLMECPRFVAPSMLGLDGNKSLEHHKMETTGFPLMMILSSSTAHFSISGPMQSYSQLMATSLDTNFL